MARTLKTVQVTNRVAGLTPTYTAFPGVDGFAVPNDAENVILHFKNTGGTNRTVTIATHPTVDGLAVPDRTYTVPATTGEIICGPFPASIYNAYDSDTSTANCLYVSCDATTSLVCSAWKPGA